MKKAAVFFATLSLLPLSPWLAAQSEPEPDPWGPFRFFIGAWEGEGKGQPGNGRVTREYAWVLDGSFIEVRNRSVYPPQEANPGEDHREIGFISFDRARAKHVLRQFHIEGFVNQYVHESTSADGKQIVFVTEAIENIPAGWRARETYTLLGPDELVERFDLAEPGQDFELYIENRLRRVKKPSSPPRDEGVSSMEELVDEETVAFPRMARAPFDRGPAGDPSRASLARPRGDGETR